MLVELEEDMHVDSEKVDTLRHRLGTARLVPPKAAPAEQTRSPVGEVPTPTDVGGSTTPGDWTVLSEGEQKVIQKRRARQAASRAKASETKALTGLRADYPSLSHTFSNEVALNMVFVMAQRMRTFLWKKLLWQLRVKKAVEMMPQARWKRNPRWLAMLLSKEVGWVYGHYGALKQKLHARDILHLM